MKLLNNASKTTPVDADNIVIADSAASSVLKYLSWANLKTALNSIYQAVLVSGTNIKTINGSSILGSGDLVISTGVISWVEVTGTTQAATVDSAYITNNASRVVVTLPTTAVIGKIIRIVGKGAGGWRVAQNASQVIYFGNMNTTTGTGGQLNSTNRRDTVALVCITANNEWQVISSVGSIDII